MKSVFFALSILFLTSLTQAVRSAETYQITTDIIYGHKAGMALTMDVVRPQKPNGVGLLYMVSRGWVSNYFDLPAAMQTSQQRNGRFAVLIERGYTLLMVRHGSAPYFTVPDAVADVRRAVRYVRYHADELQIDPDRIGVFGNSAGGHLALMLGTTADGGDPQADDPIERVANGVSAVVAYYPPVDLRAAEVTSAPLQRLQQGPLNFAAKLQASVSPLVHVGPGDAPTLLIHGDQDTSVPLTHSQQIWTAFEAAQVESKLIVLEGAGHAFPGPYGTRAAAALADWFDQHLAD